jgi:hypothetical protein
VYSVGETTVCKQKAMDVDCMGKFMNRKNAEKRKRKRELADVSKLDFFIN